MRRPLSLAILLFVPSSAWITTTKHPGHHGRAPLLLSTPPAQSASPQTPFGMLSMAADSNEDSSSSTIEKMGLNELQTLLRDAAGSQDFVEAGRLSDILATRLYGDMTDISDDIRRQRRRKMSWRGLGAAPWLVDRLDSINYTFPTTIQINAMEAVNSMLNTTSEMVESTSLEERMGVDNMNMGIVISGNTGSGTYQF